MKLLVKLFLLPRLLVWYYQDIVQKSEFLRLQNRVLELTPKKDGSIIKSDLFELTEISERIELLQKIQDIRSDYKEEILSILRDRDGGQLVKPPGQTYLKIVEYVVSKKMYQSTFEPLVADWQEEYFEALDQKRGRVKLFFVDVRYKWAFAKACGLSALIKLVIDTFKFMSGK
jgi:hypothetical protein